MHLFVKELVYDHSGVQLQVHQVLTFCNYWRHTHMPFKCQLCLLGSNTQHNLIKAELMCFLL